MVQKKLSNSEVSFEIQRLALRAIMDLYNQFIGNCDECRNTTWLQKVRKNMHTEWWCQDCREKHFGK